MSPLRLVVFDDSCRERFGFGLSTIWKVGSVGFKSVGSFDAVFGATSWQDALDWLANVEPGRSIGEIQYWGHGNFGSVRLGHESLDLAALSPDSVLYPKLTRARDRLAGPNALVWFRTCEAFGTEKGHVWAQAVSEFFGCVVAGHTHVIAWAQSGLHALAPGDLPNWSQTEGVRESNPHRALWSSFSKKNTIPFLKMRLPDWAYVSFPEAGPRREPLNPSAGNGGTSLS